MEVLSHLLSIGVDFVVFGTLPSLLIIAAVICFSVRSKIGDTKMKRLAISMSFLAISVLWYLIVWTLLSYKWRDYQPVEMLRVVSPMWFIWGLLFLYLARRMYKPREEDKLNEIMERNSQNDRGSN